MKTIEQRFEELRNTKTDRLDVPDQYEEMLLSALHPVGRVSNTGLKPLPAYDDTADLMNMLIAISRIQTRLSCEVVKLNQQISDHVNTIRNQTKE